MNQAKKGVESNPNAKYIVSGENDTSVVQT